MGDKKTIRTVRRELLEKISSLLQDTSDAEDLYRLAEALATLSVLQED